jgi:hypothetical protein
MELFETNKNVDFKDFAVHALSHLNSRKNHILSATLRSQIQKIAVNHLGLKDIFQLRDRHEGQLYMDSLILKVLALNTIEKELEIDLIDWDEVKWDKKADITLINLNKKKYRVIPFFYGGLPVVNPTIKEDIIFVSIRAEFKHGVVCGVLAKPNFDDPTQFTFKPSAVKTSMRKFIGFKFLKELVLTK